MTTVYPNPLIQYCCINSTQVYTFTEKESQEFSPRGKEDGVNWSGMLGENGRKLCKDTLEGIFLGPSFVPFLPISLALSHHPGVAVQVGGNITVSWTGRREIRSTQDFIVRCPLSHQSLCHRCVLVV